MKLKLSELYLGFQNKTFKIFTKDLADRGTIYKKETIIATLSLNKEKDCFYLSGDLETVVEYTCARCLKKNPININIPLNILILEKTMKYQTKIDHEVIYFNKSNDDVNLKSIFSDLIALAEPIQPLCDIQCTGLCPACGIEKTNACKCNNRTVSTAWDKLKDLHI
tara:strand:+ start:65 stop:562 length:498 start_codon:yes stop_codon:yes gene_type:complete